jgi:hypothetical protein
MRVVETYIFGFLHVVGYCNVLVMLTWIVNFSFYVEDYCDGVVTWVYGYPLGDVTLLL